MSELPAVTAEDVSTITLGVPLTVNVTIRNPYPKSTVAVEAMLLNDTTDTTDVYVTKIAVKEVGEAFGYHIRPHNLEQTWHECPLESRLVYSFGPIFNKGDLS